MSDDAKKFKLEDEDENRPEPELELTLTGINQPSWFGQVVNSGLNVISNVTGSISSRKKNNPPPMPPGPGPDLKLADEQPQKKPNPNSYNPTWQGDNFAPNPHIEHTNFTTAIGEFNKQQDQLPRNRVGGYGNQPIIIRRPNTGVPFMYKLIAFVLFVLLLAGTVKYLDKKYNIRQVVKELKDPNKAKLKKKEKKPIIDE